MWQAGEILINAEVKVDFWWQTDSRCRLDWEFQNLKNGIIVDIASEIFIFLNREQIFLSVEIKLSTLISEANMLNLRIVLTNM